MFEFIGSKLSARNEFAVTTAQLRRQLSMADCEEDEEFLQSFIEAAQNAIESRTGRVLSSRRMAMAYRGFGNSLRLNFAPVRSIVSIENAGSQITGAKCSGFGLRPVLWLGQDITSDELVVTVDCGYEAGEAPAELIVLVKMLAADMFEHREAQAEVSLTNNAAYMRILNMYTLIEVM